MKGLHCPRPLLTTRQTLEKMQPVQTLEVISTDSSTKASFPPYLKRSGDELVKIET
ncbi:MAG: sulfurtransferase TusA family protein [Acidobacteriota bacterium]